MSQQEQDEIIGRMIRERAETIRLMEIHRVDLRRIGAALSEIGEALKKDAIDTAASSLATWYDSLGGDHLEKLFNRLTEYRGLASKLREYDKSLASLKIP